MISPIFSLFVTLLLFDLPCFACRAAQTMILHRVCPGFMSLVIEPNNRKKWVRELDERGWHGATKRNQ
jgi:hypothetical protein